MSEEGFGALPACGGIPRSAYFLWQVRHKALPVLAILR